MKHNLAFFDQHSIGIMDKMTFLEFTDNLVSCN